MIPKPNNKKEKLYYYKIINIWDSNNTIKNENTIHRMIKYAFRITYIRLIENYVNSESLINDSNRILKSDKIFK